MKILMVLSVFSFLGYKLGKKWYDNKDYIEKLE
jgi:hypothetical protein